MAPAILWAEASGYGLEQWLEFFGCLHPLVLHLPIGLLAGVFAMETASLRWRGVVPGRRVLAALFGVSAAAAALTGWWLGQNADFHPTLVDDHRKFGIAAAVGAVLVGLLDVFFRGKRWGVLRVLLLFVCAGLFTMAGHRGGMMTHGKTFLSDTAPPWLAPFVGPAPRARAAADGASVSSEPIGDGTSGVGSTGGAETEGRGEPTEAEGTDAPVSAVPTDIALVHAAFQSLCVECHCEAKVKGDLRLDRLEGWTSTVDFDEPEFSELLYRVKLPADDGDAMPPEGARLDPEIIAALERWIHAGAPTEELSTLLGHSD